MGEKSSGKKQNIVITNDKDRPSKEEIDRMVADAEKYKGEDDAQKERIEAKNALESYAFNLKSSLENDNVKSKISEADRQKVCDKCKEELEDLATPIVKNLYANGPTAAPNSNASAGGPTV